MILSVLCFLLDWDSSNCKCFNFQDFVVRLLWLYETHIVITEYYVIYLTIVQTICTYNDFKKFLYSQTVFQHVSMVDSTIIRAVPPARTKTLLLQTFYRIMHTQIHPVSPSAQMHTLLKLLATMGNQKLGVGICTIVGMYRWVCVCVCVFVCVCLCYAYHVCTLCPTKIGCPEMLYVMLWKWCDVQLPS